MSLSDYSGKYFTPGKRAVSIRGLKFFTCNTGSTGVELAISDGAREGKVSLVIHPNALWKVANLAAACGMTPEQMKAFNEKSQNAYRWFVGKRFIGVFAKVQASNGKEYTEVVDFEPIMSGDPVPPPPPIPQDDREPEPDVPPLEDSLPVTEDEIPF